MQLRNRNIRRKPSPKKCQIIYKTINYKFSKKFIFTLICLILISCYSLISFIYNLFNGVQQIYC